MNNEVQIFDFEQMNVRTVIIDEEIWFVGKDVADILEYSNSAKAIRDHVDEEDKLTERIVLAGQNRDVIVINESGLYSLIILSKMPNAKRFKRWVTTEVLPSIRKNGSYSTASPHNLRLPENMAEMMMVVGSISSEANKRIDKVEASQKAVQTEMNNFKQSFGLPEGMAVQLKDKVQHQVKFMMGGPTSNAYANVKVRGKVYQAAWRDLKNRFHVEKYRMIPMEKFQEAVNYAGFWNPDTNLSLEIREANSQMALEV
jgi:prophage antirepressor-like protein